MLTIQLLLPLLLSLHPLQALRLPTRPSLSNPLPASPLHLKGPFAAQCRSIPNLPALPSWNACEDAYIALCDTVGTHSTSDPSRAVLRNTWIWESVQDCAAGIYIGLDVPVPGGLDCCITAGLMTNFCAGRATNETGLKDPNVGTNNVKVLPGVTRKAVAIDEGMPMYVIAGRKLTL